jgi:hypothetical protein
MTIRKDLHFPLVQTVTYASAAAIFAAALKIRYIGNAENIEFE